MTYQSPDPVVSEIQERHDDMAAKLDREPLAWAAVNPRPIFEDRATLLSIVKARPPLCLVCGASTPCMTEADLKEDDPGVPCTFEPLCVTRAYERGVEQGLVKARQVRGLRLEVALRKLAITQFHVSTTDGGITRGYHCAVCSSRWLNNDEVHEPDCVLTTPAADKEPT